MNHMKLTFEAKSENESFARSVVAAFFAQLNIPDVKRAMEPFFTTLKNGERSGMGFTVMQAFCDEVNVVSEDGTTVVTLIKKVC